MKNSNRVLGPLVASVLCVVPAIAGAQPDPSPSPLGSASPYPSPSSTATGIVAPARRVIAASSNMMMGGGAMLKTPDSTFATKAAQGGMTEVRAAKIALMKTHDPKVRAFAQKMIAQHTPNNEKLASILQGEGSTPPASVGAMHEAELAKLQSLSGAAFDSVYLSGQVTDHQKMLALMQHEASSGKDAKLVTFAKMTAPVVEMHLSTAQKDRSSSM